MVLLAHVLVAKFPDHLPLCRQSVIYPREGVVTRWRADPGGQQRHVQTHLAKFEGVLQADAYAGSNALYESVGIDEVACWAHARRKFHTLHVARPSLLTTEALRCVASHRRTVSDRGRDPRQTT